MISQNPENAESPKTLDRAKYYAEELNKLTTAEWSPDFLKDYMEKDPEGANRMALALNSGDRRRIELAVNDLTQAAKAFGGTGLEVDEAVLAEQKQAEFETQFNAALKNTHTLLGDAVENRFVSYLNSAKSSDPAAADAFNRLVVFDPSDLDALKSRLSALHEEWVNHGKPSGASSVEAAEVPETETTELPKDFDALLAEVGPATLDRYYKENNASESTVRGLLAGLHPEIVVNELREIKETTPEPAPAVVEAPAVEVPASVVEAQPETSDVTPEPAPAVAEEAADVADAAPILSPEQTEAALDHAPQVADANINRGPERAVITQKAKEFAPEDINKDSTKALSAKLEALWNEAYPEKRKGLNQFFGGFNKLYKKFKKAYPSAEDFALHTYELKEGKLTLLVAAKLKAENPVHYFEYSVPAPDGEKAALKSLLSSLEGIGKMIPREALSGQKILVTKESETLAANETAQLETSAS